MNKKTVITTVGISLLSGLKRNEIDWNLPVDEIANKMSELKEQHKICAEIASIQSLVDNGVLSEKQNLYLLSSDTREGEKINQVLKEYFGTTFQKVHTLTVEHLNGQEPDLFKEEGLRNLVKIIVQIVRTVPKQETECVINATGGYKAQISFAGLIGQVLKIPVYYQFEGFSSVVQLPEMPVTLDYKIWLKNFQLFQDLYQLGIISTKLLGSDTNLDALKGLIEQSRGQIRLSSVGLLLHEVLWNRFKEEGDLYLPPVSKVDSFLHLNESSNELPLSLRTILESIQQLPFVESVQLTGTKEAVVGPLTFEVQDIRTGLIEGTFGQNQKTWNFLIKTTATHDVEINAVIVELQQRYQTMVEPQESSVEFILVRHGQHVGEKEERIEGWADFELTEIGHEQSRLAAECLKEEHQAIDILYASSLSRARQTAEHISREIKITPIVLDDLRAMNYGQPGGLTKSEAEILYPLARKQVIFNKTYDGESDIEFNRRVIELFYELVHKHQGKTVCLVTHGRAINVILKEVMNLPLSHDFRVDSADTSIHHFVMKNNQTVIRCVNDAKHLTKLKS